MDQPPAPLPTPFPWPLFNAFVGGGSSLDVPQLHVEDLASAAEFLECYGFEWGVRAQLAELEDIRTEALRFFDQVLLPPDRQLPDEVRNQTDVRQLLIWASAPRTESRQRWTCSLLRLMHTLAHCRSPLEERWGSEIQQQILRRFRPHLHGPDDALVLGEGADAIPLAAFELKASKPRWSVLLKLLHKPKNVATDVFDRVGVRFVTMNRFDALLVIRYLRQHNIVMFANVKPTRSRNTLVDLDRLRQDLEEVAEVAEAGGLDEADTFQMLRERTSVRPYPPGGPTPANPHSAVAYRSIQYTSRQLIRVADPGAAGGHLRFFFPYEVQVMDQESFELSRVGLASHSVYKQKQLEAARRRVLGGLLDEE